MAGFQAASASPVSSFRLGRLSTILLLFPVFLAGFLTHSLLYGSKSTQLECSCQRDVAAVGIHRGALSGQQDVSAEFAERQINNPSGESSIKLLDQATAKVSMSNPQTDLPVRPDTSYKVSAQELSHEPNTSKVDGSSEAPLFSKADNPLNDAARELECHRWQSNLDHQSAFDVPKKPGVSVLAQHAQDIILYRSLLNPEILGRQHGYYIDLAANLPRALSNTYFLDVCRGWPGLCIEPQMNLAAKLKDRARWGRTCKVVDTCVASPMGLEVEFVLSGGIGGIEGVRPTHDDKAWVERMKQLGHNHLLEEDKIKTVTMKCTTLEAELQQVGVDNFPGGRTVDGRKVVDFLSLDIEGAEYLAMKGTNFDQVFIRYILMEFSPLYKISQVVSLLREKGFSPLVKLNLDVVLAHKDALPEVNMDHLRKECANYQITHCLMCEDTSNKDLCTGLNMTRYRKSRGK